MSAGRNKDSASAWIVSYNQWEQDFVSFLDEKSEYSNGSVNDMHRRLVKARHMIRRYILKGQLFTFLDEELVTVGPVPSTNNLIASWNGQLRDMLRRRRRLRLIRHCWWNHQHTKRPDTDAWLAANAITDRHEPLQTRMKVRPARPIRSPRRPMRYETGIQPERLPQPSGMDIKRPGHQTHLSLWPRKYNFLQGSFEVVTM